jgi:ribosomal protein L19E
VIMRENHERTSAVTVHRSASERPVDVRHTTSGAAAGRSIRRMAREHTLRDQVRSLRMALSDLKLQVSDLAAACGRE